MVKNIALVDLPCHAGDKGTLVAIEAEKTIPFPIARVYYIFGVDGASRRGFHAHFDLEQVLICVRGAVSVLVEDGESSEVITLNSPLCSLHIGPMVWREMFDFSEDAVLLVLASRHYEPTDYEKDHEKFLLAAKEYFQRPESR